MFQILSLSLSNVFKLVSVLNSLKHYSVFYFISEESVAFWGTRATPFSESGVVTYNTEQTDIDNDFSPSTGRFTCPDTAAYFTTFSTLASAGRRVELYTGNTDPVVGLVSTSTNGRDNTFHSRSAIVRINEGDEAYLINNADILDANAGQQISWATFNIEDAMNIDEYFFAGRTSTQLNPDGGNDLDYTNFWLRTSMAINEETNAYTCPRTGIYYFFASIGSTRHTSAIRVQAIITHERGYCNRRSKIILY